MLADRTHRDVHRNTPVSNSGAQSDKDDVVQVQGQSSTRCSAFHRRRQDRPQNKPWAPEWRIVYIYEQVCITYDSWNISFLTLYWIHSIAAACYFAVKAFVIVFTAVNVDEKRK